VTSGDDVIVDASVAAKWLVSEPDSDLAVGLLKHRLHAPDLLFPECANILWKKLTRAELAVEVFDVAVDVLHALEVTIHSSRKFLRPAVTLSRRLNHPAYDCFYMALAQALEVPFVTADERLLRRARTSALPELVTLVQPLSDWA
jgi:predicted nucleic acid-binding protein